MSDFEKHEKTSVFNQVLKEVVMVGSDFRVNLIFWNLGWLWTRFHIILYSYSYLLGMLLHIIKQAVFKHNY